ncbi:subtilisin-like protease pr1e [Trichoderma arundinaceum]|uniref:Subtilisin-like protease pr1e n=1 Tax=Trichoderma arundinaceum TaxID=490622 RepID=A0A395NIB5_TRIAR|nr:subtilisin-like protease pr1e [Trichoderma arundinaceum]
MDVPQTLQMKMTTFCHLARGVVEADHQAPNSGGWPYYVEKEEIRTPTDKDLAFEIAEPLVKNGLQFYIVEREYIEHCTRLLIRIAHVLTFNMNVPHYSYWKDDSSGAGQYMYIVDSGNEIKNHPKFQGLKNKPIPLPGKAWGNFLQMGDLHGAKVGDLAGGHRFRMANNAQLLFTETVNPVGFGGEHYLEGLLVVLEDMTENSERQFKSVINMT